MKTTIIVLTLVVGFSSLNYVIEKKTDQEDQITPAFVDFDAFVKLAVEVKEYRKDRLVELKKFMAMSKESNTVILDTRSDALYNRRHIKGAIHLDFTDFTQANLWKLIPDKNKRILIYCNNNFIGDQVNFATKSVSPIIQSDLGPQKPLTLALNIPTFINLYGYGYKNIYELSELVTISNLPNAKEGLQFEGTAVNTAN